MLFMGEKWLSEWFVWLSFPTTRNTIWKRVLTELPHYLWIFLDTFYYSKSFCQPVIVLHIVACCVFTDGFQAQCFWLLNQSLEKARKKCCLYVNKIPHHVLSSKRYSMVIKRLFLWNVENVGKLNRF